MDANSNIKRIKFIKLDGKSIKLNDLEELLIFFTYKYNLNEEEKLEIKLYLENKINELQ